MDENRQDKVGSKLVVTEGKLWLPPLSPKDQKKLDRLQKNGKRSFPKWIGFSGKTLWDWLQLLAVLAIPVVVAFLSISFSIQQEAVAQQQHQIDLKIAQDNRQKDIQIADDQQQETTLKTYLDNLSDLLLNHHLRKSKPSDEVSLVAREWTLTTLRRLKADRNRILFQFLQDAHLIGVKNAVIDLSQADLSGDDLREVNLVFVDLSGADLHGALLDGAGLHGADLHGAFLYDAHLEGADLSGADLHGAFLNRAFLYDAHLEGADLHGAFLPGSELSGADLHGALLHKADLHDATLTGADLSGADLTSAFLDDTNLVGADLRSARLNNASLQGAHVTQEQLDQASSLQGATMPDGSIHP
jgi:uncharacterized protein YjbI with pentapeptide repeats